MLDLVREAVATVAGPSLVGLYLFGSLATGDFDAGVSDIDLLTVLTDTPNEGLVGRLRRMHADLARANPAWEDRIEVVYVSTRGLATCRTRPTIIAVISSGEPFQVVEAGRDWVLTWYPAREDAVRLLGPPIDALIPPIPSAEYLEEVRRYLMRFPNRLPDDVQPGSQAFLILTMCRGLYGLRFGERRSKRAAAAWAQEVYPRWADLIGRAFGWRQRQHDPDGQDGAATVAETRSFLDEMVELVRGSPHGSPR